MDDDVGVVFEKLLRGDARLLALVVLGRAYYPPVAQVGVQVLEVARAAVGAAKLVVAYDGVVRVVAVAYLPGNYPVAVGELLTCLGRARRPCGGLVVVDVVLVAAGIEHLALLTAAVDLVDPGTAQQVHLGVFCPCVGTAAGTIDAGLIALVLVRPDGRPDVDVGVDGAPFLVVAAEDGTGDGGIVAGIVDVAVIGIAGQEGVVTVAAAEDVAHANLRATGHVDHRAACDALIEAGTEDILDGAADEVDDGRVAVGGGMGHVETLLHT